MRVVITSAAILVAAGSAFAGAPTIQSGYNVSYNHPFGGAPADQITSNVAIQRDNIRGIYNEVTESSYADSFSPADTEWSFGTTADWDTLSYADWKTAIGGNPPLSVGQNMVVHLISDDIYMDIRFTAWGSIGSGEFAYVRAPAPGAAALFGVAGIAAMRRRR